MKQINNIKFYEVNKDGEVRVVFPDGSDDYMLKRDADLYYKKLYAAKTVDKLVIETLKECGLSIDNAHLSDYNKLNEFQTKFRAKLVKNGIDMSFRKVTTNKLGIEISGNYDGITSSVVVFLWSKPWEEVKMTESELEEHILLKNIGVYIRDKYFAVKRVSKDWALKKQFGTTFRNRGIGSGASIVEESVKLKKDKFGNLYISETTMIWD